MNIIQIAPIAREKDIQRHNAVLVGVWEEMNGILIEIVVRAKEQES